MLAGVAHRLDILAWQKTEDGQNNRNQPKQLEPPTSRIDQAVDQSAIERRADKYLRRQRERGAR